MRGLAAAILCAAISATNVLAADNGTLAPGKPAGLRQAQNGDNNLPYILAGGLVIAGVVLLATGNNNGTVSSATTTTVSTPSTAP